MRHRDDFGQRDEFDDIPILRELRDQLERSFAQSAPPARRGLLARLAVALSVLGSLGVGGAAVAVLHARTGGRPRDPSGRSAQRLRTSLRPTGIQARANALVNQAAAATVHADPACRSENRGPTLVPGRPGRPLLANLGVLRRPPVASPTRATLMAGGFTAGSRVFVDFIRLARIEDGRAYYLVPEGNVLGESRIPVRCDAEMRTTLQRIDAGSPAAVRRAALVEQPAWYGDIIRRADQPGLCLAVVATHPVKPARGVNMGCSSVWDYVSPGLSGAIGLGDRGGGQTIAEVVPDPVASVTLVYRARGADPERHLTSRAVNNVVVFTIPRRTADPATPDEVIRRSAGGRTLSVQGHA